MAEQTSMLHVRVDNKLKDQAAAKLADVGLTISDAVRILLTRIVKEGALPTELIADTKAYDEWFRGKVHEALADKRGTVSHAQVMKEARALIDKKRRAKG
jgi:DNA-damage-inducible protein J